MTQAQIKKNAGVLLGRGRPTRKDNPQRINLILAGRIKKKAYLAATERRVSISRLVEDLIEAL
jgi:hypothetical protein